jgi:hypothetical protein
MQPTTSASWKPNVPKIDPAFRRSGYRTTVLACLARIFGL